MVKSGIGMTVLATCALAMGSFVGVSSARAQAVVAPLSTSTPARVPPQTPRRSPADGAWTQAPIERGGASEFRAFGLPVRVKAPVAAPYSGSAYRDFGGQPESSADAAVASQGMDTR